jgi:competence protein ComGC
MYREIRVVIMIITLIILAAMTSCGTREYVLTSTGGCCSIVITEYDIQYLDEDGIMVDRYTDEDMWTADVTRDDVIQEYQEHCYKNHN